MLDREHFARGYREGERDSVAGMPRALVAEEGDEPPVVKAEDSAYYHGYKAAVEGAARDEEGAWSAYVAKHSMRANAGPMGRRAIAQSRMVGASEADGLPVGSLLWADDRAWAVVPGGIAPVALLAERAGGHVPDGEPAASIASTFALMRQGDGRVPTHGTAQRHAITWVQAARTTTPNPLHLSLEGSYSIGLGTADDKAMRANVGGGWEGPGNYGLTDGEIARAASRIAGSDTLFSRWQGAMESFRTREAGDIVADACGAPPSNVDAPALAEVAREIARIRSGGRSTENQTMRSNAGIYSGSSASQDDYVIHYHHRGGFAVDRVGYRGTHTTIGPTRGYPTITDALKAIEYDAHVQGILSGVVFLQGEDDMGQIGSVIARGTGYAKFEVGGGLSLQNPYQEAEAIAASRRGGAHAPNAGRDNVLWQDTLLTWVSAGEAANGDPRGLNMVPTPEGQAAAQEMLEDRGGGGNASPLDQEHFFLEAAQGNGWSTVPPQDIGALTDATIVSMDGFIGDNGRWYPHPDVARPVVYAHMNYAVEDPVEMWAAGKPVFWVADVLEMTTEQRAMARQELASATGEAYEANARAGKAWFGQGDGNWEYGIKIDGIENDFPLKPLGRQEEWDAVKSFQASARTDWISAKSASSGAAALKRWVKAVSPSQFFAKYSSGDDSIKVWFTSEGHEPNAALDAVKIKNALALLHHEERSIGRDAAFDHVVRMFGLNDAEADVLANATHVKRHQKEAIHEPNARKNVSSVIDAFLAGRKHSEKTCRSDGWRIYSYALLIAARVNAQGEPVEVGAPGARVLVLDKRVSPSVTTSGQINAVLAAVPGAQVVSDMPYETRYLPNAAESKPLGETSSGKPVLEPTTGPYVERFRLPKWNAELTVLGYVQVPRGHVQRLFPEWTKADHREAAEIMALASDAALAEWNKLVADAVQRYGDGDGRLISGVYREHFPEETKEALRYLAHFANDATSASAFHHYATGSRTPWQQTDMHPSRRGST